MRVIYRVREREQGQHLPPYFYKTIFVPIATISCFLSLVEGTVLGSSLNGGWEREEGGRDGRKERRGEGGREDGEDGRVK